MVLTWKSTPQHLHHNDFKILLSTFICKNKYKQIIQMGKDHLLWTDIDIFLKVYQMTWKVIENKRWLCPVQPAAVHDSQSLNNPSIGLTVNYPGTIDPNVPR